MRTHGEDMAPHYQSLHDMYIEGRSYNYMARKIGVSVGSVAGTLFRMRHGLLTKWNKQLATRGREGARWSSGYDNKARAQPSLPKLKFLEDA